MPSKSFLKHEISQSLINLVMWLLFQPIRTLEILKLSEISWDLLKKYFHLKSNAVYNSSTKNEHLSHLWHNIIQGVMKACISAMAKIDWTKQSHFTGGCHMSQNQ